MTDLSRFTVRVVPNVMTRIDLRQEDGIEWRLHCFARDLEGTYVHNHSYSFDTLCLFGSYIERQFAIDNQQSDASHYAFVRNKGGELQGGSLMPGALVETGVRHHSAGNVLHVAVGEHHSTSPPPSQDGDAASAAWALRRPGRCPFATVTFVRIQRPREAPAATTILSTSPDVAAPHEAIRAPREEELAQLKDMLAFLAEENSDGMQACG